MWWMVDDSGPGGTSPTLAAVTKEIYKRFFAPKPMGGFWGAAAIRGRFGTGGKTNGVGYGIFTVRCAS